MTRVDAFASAFLNSGHSRANNRLLERYDDWLACRDRMSKLRLAGYRFQATDMGEVIYLHIWPGPKHADLSRLPPREA